MRKIPLLLSAFIVFTCIVSFAGCEKKAAATFEDTEGLAVAVSLCYHLTEWNTDGEVITPDFALHTAGWYAAYNARINGSDEPSLSETQVNELKSVLLNGMTENISPDSIGALKDKKNKETYWTFTEINENFSAYMGIRGSIVIDNIAEQTYRVTLQDHLRFGEMEDFVFNISFIETDNGYVMSEFKITPPLELDFTSDMLYSENLLSNLLDLYGTMEVKEDCANGFVSKMSFARTEKGFMSCVEDGERTDGFYDNFRYFDQRAEGGRVYAMPVHEDADWLDGFLSDNELPGDAEIQRLVCREDEEVFYCTYDNYSTVYTIDRGSLALKRIEIFDKNDVSVNMMTFTYRVPLTTPEIFESWEKPLRTVTVHMLFADEKEETESWQIPGDWELDINDYFDRGVAYLDDGCTIPYEYPGDDLDYAVWITSGLG